jgi:hypothetical protein
MNIQNLSIALAASLFLSPVISFAGPCDARFAFDGNLADSEGNVDAGQMITKEGDIVKPVFVEGRSGQALSLDGTSAMRVLLDLHYDACPQVTLSAWINISSATPSRTQFLLSTGSGSGPGIRVAGTSLAINGPANGLLQQRAVRPGAGWQFVAAVYDFDNETFALYRGNRKAEVTPMSGRRVEWEDAFWVGAMNDSMTGAATGILFDDVRIVGSALTYDQVSQLKLNEFELTQVPGDQFDRAQLPGDQFEPAQMPDGDSDLTGPNILPHVPADDYDGLIDNRDDALAGANILPGATGDASGGSGPASTPPPDQAGEAAPPAPANLKPTPVGDRKFSGVSGFSGRNQNIIDLYDRFASGIAWDEAQNRPCSISVHPMMGQGDPSGRTLAGCGSIINSLWSGALSAHLNNDVAIGSLEVCHNGNDNHRLKGIRIVGNRINADGTSTWEPNGDADQEPNCAVWATAVLCPGQSHATGLVIHSNTSSGNNAEIVGLQLVCRDIGMR